MNFSYFERMCQHFLQAYKNEHYIIRKKAEFLFYFSIVVLVISIVGIIFHGENSVLRLYIFLGISFSTILLFIYKGKLRLAVWLTLSLLCLSILDDILRFDFTSYEKIVETIMESFFVYTVIGLFAIRRSQVIYALITNTLLTSLHAYLIIHVVYSSTPLPDDALRYFIGGIVAVILVGFITLGISTTYNKALKILEKDNLSLTITKHELEQIVNERTEELKMKNIELEEKNEKLLEVSMMDSLTGVYNHKKIINIANDIIMRENHHLSIAIFDIDNFKEINDNYGHLIGDKVITTIVNICRASLRETDYLGRIGGDEFLMIFNKLPTPEVKKILERLMHKIEQANITIPTKPNLKLTLSIGVSEWKTGDELMNIIDKADKALYHSKKEGKNRITIADVNEMVI